MNVITNLVPILTTSGPAASKDASGKKIGKPD